MTKKTLRSTSSKIDEWYATTGWTIGHSSLLYDTDEEYETSKNFKRKGIYYAGIMNIKNNFITYIDNQSGHYNPKKENFNKIGVDIDQENTEVDLQFM